MFGFESFTELSKPRDLENIRSAEYTKGAVSGIAKIPVCRADHAACSGRLPYGKDTKPIRHLISKRPRRAARNLMITAG